MVVATLNSFNDSLSEGKFLCFSEVVGLLQDEGIEYRYDANSGAIRVPEATVESTRVSLLSKGYPKAALLMICT